MKAAAVAPARRAAFEILKSIGRGRMNSDALLSSPSMQPLSVDDRSLATALVLGTLRWQRVLDRECRRFLTHPSASLPEDAELALRVGAYQLLFLDRIPAHAAIFESVEWCKHSVAARHAGLVNAVLRKIAVQPKPHRFDPVEAMPEWMAARWRAEYGDDACRRICEQAQQEPHTALRLLRPEAEAELRATAVALAPGNFMAKARYVDSTRLPDGLAAQFQDEGSQLVAELLGKGEHILDCCAAPGNKTAVILANNPSAELVTWDLHPQRLATMERRLSALFPQNRIQYRVIDAARPGDVGPENSAQKNWATAKPENKTPGRKAQKRETNVKLELFDRILCDVPCSGTGTLARNPEIRHRLRPEDFSRQAARQRAILSAALERLTPRGRLLYSTCSLEPEENEQVVHACLRGSSREVSPGDWHRLDLCEEFDRLTQQGIVRGEAVAHLRATAFRDGFLRTLPGVQYCDGFFAALIERR